MSPPDHRPARSWISSDRAVPRLLVRPLREFLDTEVAGGRGVARRSSHRPRLGQFSARRHLRVTVAHEGDDRCGRWALVEDLRHWVNDGLMAVFFFVVGLEIKRELVDGELRTGEGAALPVLAAAAAAWSFPPLLYLVLTPEAGRPGVGDPDGDRHRLRARRPGAVRPPGPAGAQGLSVELGDRRRCRSDRGDSARLHTRAGCGVHCAGRRRTARVVALRAMRVWWVPIYVVIGTAIWFATLRSGVHATIAGVILGLLTPVRALTRMRCRIS